MPAMKAQWEWLCVFTLVALLPPGASVVPVAAEPHHHLVLQNSHLRAFRVEVLPHEQTLLHHHASDYVSVILAGAEVENDVEGKPPAIAKSAAGDVRLTAAPLTHLVKNVGNTPFRNVTVEILGPPAPSGEPGAPAAQSPARTADGVTRTPRGETAAVRVSETIINPGITVAEHTHAVPHLLLALSDLELQSKVAGRPPETVRLAPGEVRWFEAGLRHTVTNLSPGPAHYVTLDFK
jgi:quercetin dioxygenase-like cupin family protein